MAYVLYLQFASQSYRTSTALAGLPSLWMDPALAPGCCLLLLTHHLCYMG